MPVRLFLSSFRLSDAPHEMSRMVDAGAHVGVVLNARDNLPECTSLRAEWMDEQRRALATLGLTASELDLRDYIVQPTELPQALAGVDLVWVTGGNVFVLREAMRRSRFDALLVELLDEDAIAYGGYSAGACITGPTLRGIELVDDVSAVAQPHWDGLGLVDFSLAPHYRSEHPESAAMNDVVAYFRAKKLPYRTLCDGQALIIRDGNTRLVGGDS